MDNSAFGEATGIPYESGPQYDEEKDKRQKVLDGLKNKSSSPSGAASQEGALGAPASAGDNSPALGEVGRGEGGSGMDMVSLFMGASEEEKDKLTKAQTESFAPHGKSLEGGFLDVLKQGGPQAMARAAQFGIDLEPWASKLNPDQSGMALGQEMGNIPSDENSGQPAFKTKEQALSDNKAKTKGMADAATAKKKSQRDAIAAFLTETGLRIMASNRPTAEAFGQAALGTMDSTRQRRRQKAADSMAASESERKTKREDAADSRAVRKDAREEAKAGRDELEKITTKDGTIEYVKVQEGTVVDKDGKKIREATSADLSAAQEATDRRNYDSTLNSKIEKVKSLDKYEREALYPETKGLKGKVLRAKIEELAKAEIQSQRDSGSQVTNYNDLDW